MAGITDLPWVGEGKRCECELCQVGRLFKEITTETPYYKHQLDGVWMMLEAEMGDAQYWREKYKGTWPSDLDYRADFVGDAVNL